MSGGLFCSKLLQILRLTQREIDYVSSAIVDIGTPKNNNDHANCNFNINYTANIINTLHKYNSCDLNENSTKHIYNNLNNNRNNNNCAKTNDIANVVSDINNHFNGVIDNKFKMFKCDSCAVFYA
jgi:hypothetical protein